MVFRLAVKFPRLEHNNMSFPVIWNIGHEILNTLQGDVYNFFKSPFETLFFTLTLLNLDKPALFDNFKRFTKQYKHLTHCQEIIEAVYNCLIPIRICHQDVSTASKCVV